MYAVVNTCEATEELDMKSESLVKQIPVASKGKQHSRGHLIL